MVLAARVPVGSERTRFPNTNARADQPRARQGNSLVHGRPPPPSLRARHAQSSGSGLPGFVRLDKGKTRMLHAKIDNFLWYVEEEWSTIGRMIPHALLCCFQSAPQCLFLPFFFRFCPVSPGEGTEANIKFTRGCYS